MSCLLRGSWCHLVSRGKPRVMYLYIYYIYICGLYTVILHLRAQGTACHSMWSLIKYLWSVLWPHALAATLRARRAILPTKSSEFSQSADAGLSTRTAPVAIVSRMRMEMCFRVCRLGSMWNRDVWKSRWQVPARNPYTLQNKSTQSATVEAAWRSNQSPEV